MNNIDEKITASAVISATLDEATKTDPNLLVVTCDSRGSAGLVPFTNKHPERTVEMGIAEQNAVTVAAGLPTLASILLYFHQRPSWQCGQLNKLKSMLPTQLIMLS